MNTFRNQNLSFLRSFALNPKQKSCQRLLALAWFSVALVSGKTPAAFRQYNPHSPHQKKHPLQA
jgi:hypothetical protein